MDKLGDARPFFRPWVGSRYSTGYARGVRLLILGESHYGGGRPEPDLTRQLTQMYISGKWSHRYWTNIMQMVEGKPHAEIDRADFWNRVAFYNYVQEFVGDYWGIRPTEEMWRKAQGPFFTVLGELQPSHVLVISGRLWDNLPDRGEPGLPLRAAEGTHDTWYYPVTGAKSAFCTWVPHASWISPTSWHPVVQAFLRGRAVSR